MNLAKSIFTSMFITLVTWGSVAAQEQPKAKPNTTGTAKVELHYISVLQKRADLNRIELIWKEAYEKLESVSEDNLSTIIVVYKDLSQDFAAADITIGYQSNTAAKGEKSTIELSHSKQVLLNKGSHDKSAIENAWNDIDYRREIEVIIETHDLNQHGLPDSNSLTVYYKD
ncbi:hypothetical protein JCM19240_4978 [Vibrio maritimus]|uniref:Uncharacterized protein n=1 Tax=Vibrio maritimus TaxID=990268 RepID=A0A090TJL0_9VIBR|nr:hypothetical protein JCM19240_4978 [Vibrio maritimus]